MILTKLMKELGKVFKLLSPGSADNSLNNHLVCQTSTRKFCGSPHPCGDSHISIQGREARGFCALPCSAKSYLCISARQRRGYTKTTYAPAGGGDIYKGIQQFGHKRFTRHRELDRNVHNYPI
jgi:hypothetical protein